VRARSRRTKGLVALVGVSYLLIGVVLWGNAWANGASTHTLCGCGDPALFLWFFQWPATAIAHGHNPLYSTAMFHPHGINLLSQTSVLGLSVPLIPVTWIWGPVASLNVAATLAPALSAFCMFWVLRRWVKWMPAAYIGGLIYGFSPSVVTSLQFAHLMTAAVMLLPLIVAALDEILLRQQHSARAGGLVLGVLLFLQFFLSSELLALSVLLAVIAILLLIGAGLILDRERLRQLAPHAVQSLVIGSLVGTVLLVYPVWFALDGPAHLSGLIWPNLGSLGGYDGSSFVGPDIAHGLNVYSILGGYQGSALPSSAYLGWGFLGVLAAGLVVWFRDRRLWFFGALFGICVACSFGERDGEWEPVRMFSHIPVVENIIVQRFMIVGFLAAAVMLAVILEHARRDVPRWLEQSGAAAVLVGGGAALGLSAIALVPVASAFSDALPFTMRPVALPRWYTQVAPHLPPNRVLLTYPAPFSGIQVGLAWQAVDAMHFSQAGGGGPQGVAHRAGSAKAGFNQLAQLAFGVAQPAPEPTASVLKAVRQAIGAWGVNTVVIAPGPADESPFEQGHNPAYAAGFMTAVLGSPPRIEAGAWVWNDVSVSRGHALTVNSRRFNSCVAYSHPYLVNQSVTSCVESIAIHR
jgi:hypothetical protein